MKITSVVWYDGNFFSLMELLWLYFFIISSTCFFTYVRKHNLMVMGIRIRKDVFSINLYIYICMCQIIHLVPSSLYLYVWFSLIYMQFNYQIINHHIRRKGSDAQVCFQNFFCPFLLYQYATILYIYPLTQLQQTKIQRTNIISALWKYLKYHIVYVHPLIHPSSIYLVLSGTADKMHINLEVWGPKTMHHG